MLDLAVVSYQKQRVSDSAERQQLLHQEIERLTAELGILERQWGKRHYLLLFGLLTIPAYFVFGAPALALGLLGTPALFATQSYLLAVRRTECKQLIDEARRSIARLSRASLPASPPAAVTPPKAG
jgi:hypothetical protein